METRNRICNLLRAIEREGIEDLISWMDESGFFFAPCSSKYHLAKPGGLAEHSMNVFHVANAILNTLCASYNKPLSNELIDSVIICSLLHDLGKTGQFGKPTYIHTATQECQTIGNPFAMEADVSITYETNKDLLYTPHEVRSIAIASRFIELTEEEQFAILYHNGLYGELKSIKGNETMLYMILHFADMWASRVIEKEI